MEAKNQTDDVLKMKNFEEKQVRQAAFPSNLLKNPVCSSMYLLCPFKWQIKYEGGSSFCKSIDIHYVSARQRGADGSEELSSHTDSSFVQPPSDFCLLAQNEWRSATSSQRRISSIPTSFSKWTNSALLFWAPATSCTVSRLRFHGNSVRMGTHGKAARTDRAREEEREMKNRKFLLGRAEREREREKGRCGRSSEWHHTGGPADWGVELSPVCPAAPQRSHDNCIPRFTGRPLALPLANSQTAIMNTYDATLPSVLRGQRSSGGGCPCKHTEMFCTHTRQQTLRPDCVLLHLLLEQKLMLC